MKAYIFPGQGAQFSGMGLDLYEVSPKAKDLFHQANDILGFEITKTMFEGTTDELKETKVTQPAIFLHSTIIAEVMGETVEHVEALYRNFERKRKTTEYLRMSPVRDYYSSYSE